jgi:uncharacterized protein (DUF2141 family)
MGKMLSSLVLKFGALWIALYLPPLSPPATNVIGVHVQNLHGDKGQVICSLFSSPEGFPKDSRKGVRRVTSAISARQASCEFSEIPPGTYAIAVFHDENSNGKLDTNFLGIPREGVGASNGATGHLGPPKFDAAAFQFSGGRLNLEIVIRYL